jgi:hypothetical protein
MLQCNFILWWGLSCKRGFNLIKSSPFLKKPRNHGTYIALVCPVPFVESMVNPSQKKGIHGESVLIKAFTLWDGSPFQDLTKSLSLSSQFNISKFRMYFSPIQLLKQFNTSFYQTGKILIAPRV